VLVFVVLRGFGLSIIRVSSLVFLCKCVQGTNEQRGSKK
jgi:hypothetical protein